MGRQRCGMRAGTYLLSLAWWDIEGRLDKLAFSFPLGMAFRDAFLIFFEELLETLTEFKSVNWYALVDYATAYSADDIQARAGIPCIIS